MVRAQITNGEPMGTKDIESQIKFLKEDIDFLLLNPESSGYTKIPYDSRKRRYYPTPRIIRTRYHLSGADESFGAIRLELAQRIKSLVDYLQYRLVTGKLCHLFVRVVRGVWYSHGVRGYQSMAAASTPFSTTASAFRTLCPTSCKGTGSRGCLAISTGCTSRTTMARGSRTGHTPGDWVWEAEEAEGRPRWELRLRPAGRTGGCRRPANSMQRTSLTTRVQ